VSFGLVLHRTARADLAEIWQWTAVRWGGEQAEAYLAGLKAAIGLLLDSPEMAHERPEISPPVRLYPCRSHVVIYRLSGDSLIVHRVVHGRSNWQSQL
jgi:toxin ParE1/3/4